MFCVSLRLVIVWFALINIVLSWLSKIKPKCFWMAVCLTFVLLKLSGVWNGFLILREKITSCAFLVGSGLRLIFHWVAQSSIIFKSSLRIFIEVFKLWTTGKRDMLSANKIESWDTPAVILAQYGYCTYSATLFYLESKLS